MRLTDFLERQSRTWIFIAGLILTAIVGVGDYLLGTEVTLFAFYLAVILIVAWYAGGRVALIVGVISVAIWWVADDSPQKISLKAWRALNRYTSFIVVALGGAAMRAQRASIRERLALLEEKRGLQEEIVRAGEREQVRIGQDLHDGLCQHLAAIDCAVACLKDDVQEHLPAKANAADFIHQQLQRAIKEARSLARGIVPAQMAEGGFLAALKELVEFMRSAHRIEIALEAPSELTLRSPAVSMHLYRITQEALNNAAKHAKATRISVKVKESGESLTLAVTDNGIGIGADRPSGLGLRTMKYRAESIGASLNVESTARAGTTVTCADVLN